MKNIKTEFNTSLSMQSKTKVIHNHESSINNVALYSDEESAIKAITESCFPSIYGYT